jgi:hypothetical protein
MAKVEFHELVSRLKALAKELDKTPSVSEFIASGESKRQILKYKHSELVRAAGLPPNKHSRITPPTEIIRRDPKILCFDLELAPLVLQGWGLYDQNFGLNQIERDWFILSFAAKFLDKDEIHYFDQRNSKDLADDLELVQRLHKIINEADILLGHNLDKFDVKKLNARFIRHSLPPIHPKQTIDTLKIAKKFFSFTSNKLEYIAKFLKCEEKSKHSKFLGHTLWSECLNGNEEAFKEMEIYNKQDVITTIEVYQKLVVYDPSINFQTFGQARICSCGGTSFFKNGLKYTKQGIFQLYRCPGCGKGFVEKENLVNKHLRKELFK